MVYFGASAAITVLERLAHTDPDLLPNDLHLACFEFSKSAVAAADVSPLPRDWIAQESATRKLAALWRRAGSSALLAVPSAILPEESNYVLNPQHSEAKILRIVRQRRFTFDPQLI